MQLYVVKCVTPNKHTFPLHTLGLIGEICGTASYLATLQCVAGKGQECAVFKAYSAFLIFPPAMAHNGLPSVNAGTLAP